MQTSDTTRRARPGRAGGDWSRLAGALALYLAVTLATAQGPTIHQATVAVELDVLVDSLTLPVSVLALDDGRERLLVTQLEGLVMLIEDGAVQPTPFLDVRARMTALEGEQGFYSVALEGAERASARGHARHLVAAFTERDTGDLIVAGYPTSDDVTTADASREVVLLRVPMPEPFHHGGQVAFGPDGMLYASVGDGLAEGRSGPVDPAPPQSLSERRGKLLRIDPFPAERSAPYRVPDDNPWASSAPAGVDAAVAAEVWALGFRNPWRFAFDAPTGDLYLADVGSDQWEEINLVAAGDNHGWPVREGPDCSRVPGSETLVDPNCASHAFASPLVALPHASRDPDGARAIVAGVVVRDPDLPGLHGRYLFGDVVSGRVWSLERDSGRIELLLETGLTLSAIATGHRDEVLLLGLQGVLARIVPATP